MSKFITSADGVIFSQCLECKHFQGNFSCDAFDNIPMIIYSNDRTHNKPFAGDHGIRFEPIEEKEPNA